MSLKSPCHILSIGFPGRCDPTRSFRARTGLIYQTQNYHECHREWNRWLTPSVAISGFAYGIQRAVGFWAQYVQMFIHFTSTDTENNSQWRKVWNLFFFRVLVNVNAFSFWKEGKITLQLYAGFIIYFILIMKTQFLDSWIA